MRSLWLLLALTACSAEPILTSDGGPGSDAGRDAARPDANLRHDYPPGEPGCGLEAAALCDTFDDVAPSGLGEGRVGELDPRRWSGARTMPGLNNAGAAVPVPPATLAPCREDLPAQVYPGQDAVVCDGTTTLESRHLMTAAAEQSYGQLSLRARQPFDFFDREGRIVFDADVDGSNILHGWVSIAVTEDPSPAPSFGIEDNFENGAIPRNGIEIHLLEVCGLEHAIGVGHVSVFEDWVEHVYAGMERPCVATQDGALDHFEVRLSQSHLEVWASAPSEDGVRFPEAQRIYALDVDLPFERGYVHFTTHNHSTLKYSTNTIDSFVVRWDNLGFDGPVVGGWREHSIADAMTPTHQDITGHPVTVPRDCMNAGYPVDEEPTRFTFTSVDTAGVTYAQIALDAQVQTIGAPGPFDAYALRYRVNGGAWRDYTFPSGQLRLVTAPIVFGIDGAERDRGGSAGTFSALLEVDPSELVPGDNTLELATQNIPLGWAPYVVNIDLVLRTE